MLNYLFGRLLYDAVKLFGKGMYYIFYGITYFMYLSIKWACMVLWYILKYMYLGTVFCCKSLFSVLWNMFNTIKEKG